MEPNSILLAVLIHLGTISSPATYTNCTISEIEHINHAQVEETMNNPSLMNYVLSEYSDEAEAIEIQQIECD